MTRGPTAFCGEQTPREGYLLQPDLKSDVRSNVPGVRIPRYPPYLRSPYTVAGFLLPILLCRLNPAYDCISLFLLLSYDLKRAASLLAFPRSR